MLSVAIQLYTNGSDPACELRMPTAKRLVLTRRKGRELLVGQRESFPVESSVLIGVTPHSWSRWTGDFLQLFKLGLYFFPVFGLAFNRIGGIGMPKEF